MIANDVLHANCITVPSDMFTANDYETPDRIASLMSRLILPSDACGNPKGERLILEPCAGSGQIAKFLPKDKNQAVVHCIEIKYTRFLEGRENAPHCWWMNEDFLTTQWGHKYNCIVTNPPFEYAMQFIEKSLSLLKPDGRLIFLMPVDTFSSVGRSRQFKAMDAHVERVYLIPGRIDYLKEGKPMSQCQKVIDGIPQFNKKGEPVMMSGRQVSDACFIIRQGKKEGAIAFLDEVV